MNRLLAGKAILVLNVLTACTAQDAPRDEVPVTYGPRPSPEMIAGAVDSLAARVVAQNLTPALGVAVVMDGRTILARSYGVADVTDDVPADDGTLWYIASTSKSLTGFGISLLAHQGVVDFNLPITSLLPHAQWPRGYDASERTLADFLAHTHQLGDEAITISAAFTGALPESQYPALLRYAKPQRRRELSYSNLGYYVAAMVIDAKRPEGWRRYLDSAVYQPAGMNNTYARVSSLDRRRIAMPHTLLADGRYVTAPFYKTDATMTSAGGHLSTMRDLARWITVQMDGGVIDSVRVFPAEAVALSQRMIAPQTDDERKRFAFFERAGWAAGWDIGSYQGEPMVSRFGSYSSTRSHLSFLPRRRIGVVAQTNGELAFAATDILAAFAYDLENGHPNARALAEERLQSLVARRPGALADIASADSILASRVQPQRRPWSDFAGSYRHPWYGTITFEVRGDSLHYRWGALYGVATGRSDNGRVLRIPFVDSGTSVAFDFPQSGPATSLEMRDEKFRRVTPRP
jgi:CubicO group peptidase (beta-lactamase class C family)